MTHDDFHLPCHIPERCNTMGVVENNVTLGLSVAAVEKKSVEKVCDVPQLRLLCPTNEIQACFQGGAL